MDIRAPRVKLLMLRTSPPQFVFMQTLSKAQNFRDTEYRGVVDVTILK